MTFYYTNLTQCKLLCRGRVKVAKLGLISKRNWRENFFPWATNPDLMLTQKLRTKTIFYHTVEDWELAINGIIIVLCNSFAIRSISFRPYNFFSIINQKTGSGWWAVPKLYSERERCLQFWNCELLDLPCRNRMWWRERESHPTLNGNLPFWHNMMLEWVARD